MPVAETPSFEVVEAELALQIFVDAFGAPSLHDPTLTARRVVWAVGSSEIDPLARAGGPRSPTCSGTATSTPPPSTPRWISTRSARWSGRGRGSPHEPPGPAPFRGGVPRASPRPRLQAVPRDMVPARFRGLPRRARELGHHHGAGRALGNSSCPAHPRAGGRSGSARSGALPRTTGHSTRARKCRHRTSSPAAPPGCQHTSTPMARSPRFYARHAPAVAAQAG